MSGIVSAQNEHQVLNSLVSVIVKQLNNYPTKLQVRCGILGLSLCFTGSDTFAVRRITVAVSVALPSARSGCATASWREAAADSRVGTD